MTKKQKIHRILNKLFVSGNTLQKPKVEIREVERVVEKIIEKPVEKIVEKVIVKKSTDLPFFASVVKKFASQKKEIASVREEIKAVELKILEIPKMPEIPEVNLEPLEKKISNIKEELQESIRKEKLDILQRMAYGDGKGGGNANRQIRIGGTDALTKYTDINFVAGAGITLATANDETNRRVNITITGAVNGSGTANEIAYWVDADTLGALAVATYPSLTELSYVKGVTSAIQSQFSGKLSLSGGTMTGGLVLVAGTTTIQPLKMVAGTNLTVPVAGVFEFDGTDLFFSV